MAVTPMECRAGVAAASRFQCFWSAGVCHSKPWRRMGLVGVGLLESFGNLVRKGVRRGGCVDGTYLLRIPWWWLLELGI
jgi:hypothetical protein